MLDAGKFNLLHVFHIGEAAIELAEDFIIESMMK
ncbi:hypothetical protein Ga0451573_003984, partial [Peptococcaceae bacterium DYL19]|nr:hypothetical protein [Phosphitispora fastidiosa]